MNGADNLVDNSFSWNPQTFAGFYYDIKKELGTETLKFVLTVDNKLSGDAPYGVTYTTTVQNKAFERSLWGSYKIIGFQADRYFAGYNQGVDEASGSDIFNAESTDKNSLSSKQLEKILIDNKDELAVTSGGPLKLEEGYQLAIKSIDIDGNKVYLELSKNGAVVDSKVVSPSKDGATEADKTYSYKNPAVGEQKKLVTIGVHFKNAFRDADSNLASIDGVWQISDTPLAVKADTQYEKLTIRTVDATAGTITMDNKDNAVTLSKNKDVVLMPGISIQTADNDTLRFFIYKPVTIEGEVGNATTTTAPAENVVPYKTTEPAPVESAPATTTAAPAMAENVVPYKTTEPAPVESAPATTTASPAPVESAPATTTTAPAPLKENGPGRLANDIPQSMNVLEAITVTAYITSDFAENISNLPIWERTPQVKNITVAERMEVTLVGVDFDIEPLSEKRQNLTDGSATWEWLVEPTKIGKKTLTINAETVQPDGTLHHYKTNTQTVTVEVGSESILEWIQDNWKLIASSLGGSIVMIIGFLKWIYPLLKLRLGRKKQEDGKKEE